MRMFMFLGLPHARVSWATDSEKNPEKFRLLLLRLEMMLYLSFPVTMFWISNQAEYFEEYIVKRKREIFPPDEGRHRKELEDFKERMRVRREQRILKEMSVESEN
ncbi:hypothetical protein L3Q82_014087 [Scortum barcoo]|uniref:Uncharacterized protein n=1 Tax=Scortum barcoo TaxID=214431 RepID=A0ACB8VVJ3_9TELE|nr:hypothetical protein L3Q82_014087 [Scortum barcoo]